MEAVEDDNAKCLCREMAVGNTFGATALSSYGGFWISFAIILTPGGFEIQSTLESASANAFADSFGLYLIVNHPDLCFYRRKTIADAFHRAGSSLPSSS